MIDLEFSHVSKQYIVRSDGGAAPAGGGVNGFVDRLRRLRGRTEAFWAVRDVSFQVRRGEALGIIGHNGAGKSTILKLLSNITAPSEGAITINGRLSALIEVGSGFHPELTGRENVFLSGSILGMRRREIAAKLDSIVDFAGVRQFIDTPVKRYSSGMYVRLGFAIAAHLDPDILLLDEVLAVGDAAFQAKCIQRIKELEQAGTTIVFISHDLSAVERLCQRVILMRKGQVESEGLPRDVIAEYNRLAAATDAPAGGPSAGALREWHDPATAPGNDAVRVRRVRIRTAEGQTAATHDIRHPIGIEVSYQVLEPGHVLIPNYHVINQDGVHLFTVQDVASEWRQRPRPVGEYVSTAWIPGNFLAAGTMSVDVALSSHVPFTAVHAFTPGAVAFHVAEHYGGDAARGDYGGDYPGRRTADGRLDHPLRGRERVGRRRAARDVGRLGRRADRRPERHPLGRRGGHVAHPVVQHAAQHFERQLRPPERRAHLHALYDRSHPLEHLARDREPLGHAVLLAARGRPAHAVEDGVGYRDARHLVGEELGVARRHERPDPGDHRRPRRAQVAVHVGRGSARAAPRRTPAA
jgi:lipopolysaccharide transport system ATP-binding protein